MKAQVARNRRISKVIITRSSAGNTELAAKLMARGFEPVEVETIAFLPPKDWSLVDSALGTLREFDWVIFTSVTGARFFSKRMKQLSLGLQWEGVPRVAAIGEKTADSLKREGIKVDFVPSRYLSKALAEELPTDSGKRLLVMRADIGDRGFVPALEKRGMAVTDLAIYRTVEVSGQPSVGDADAVIFASPSAVEGFTKRLGFSSGAKLVAFCIGPVTAAAARSHGFARIVAPEEHTIDALVGCVEREAEGGS